MKKKLKFPYFMVLLREGLITISKDEYCAKVWVLMEIFHFLSKFFGFKGYIAHEMSYKILKKIKFPNCMECLREVLIIISKDEYCAKVWVLMEISNFLSKFLGFKVYFP